MGFPSLFSVEDKVAFVTGAGSGRVPWTCTAFTSAPARH